MISAVLAGTCIFIMNSHFLVGAISFFIAFIGLFLLVFYSTAINIQLRRRNQIYCIMAATEKVDPRRKTDFIPTQVIVNYFVFVIPWVVTGIYTMASDRHVSKEIKDLTLIVYSLSFVIHPLIYTFRRLITF